MTEPVLRRDPFRLVGAVLDGRFHVEREVAEGGFGVVYYAIQIALERPVALKVLKTPSGMDTGARVHFRDRFAAEAKTIARIRHPHIVDVHDFGISKMPTGEEAPWMALEWLRGKTLDEYLSGRRGQGGQSPAHVLALLRPVLRAFAHAHREGIAHRDIKPANIMVVSTDSGGSTPDQGALLRVLDFGIAKLMDSNENPGTGQTRTAGMPAFSPPYAAPEQMAFGRTGPWTDVHALGLILTEMLVDGAPYQEQNLQLFEEVMSTHRPTPKTRGRNVGPWEAVIAKALALSPSERWKGAGELLAALEASVDAATAAASAPARPPVAGRRPLVREHTPPSDNLTATLGLGITPSTPLAGSGRSQRWILIAAVVGVGLALAIILAVSRRGLHQVENRSSVENPINPQSTPTQQTSPPAITTTKAIAPEIRTAKRPAAAIQENEPSTEHPATNETLYQQPERQKAAKRPEASHRRALKIQIE